MVKPERFYAMFDEEWKVVERNDGTEYETSVVNWRILREACFVIPPCVPQSSEIRMLLSSGH